MLSASSLTYAVPMNVRTPPLAISMTNEGVEALSRNPIQSIGASPEGRTVQIQVTGLWAHMRVLSMMKTA